MGYNARKPTWGCTDDIVSLQKLSKKEKQNKSWVHRNMRLSDCKTLNRFNTEINKSRASENKLQTYTYTYANIYKVKNIYITNKAVQISSLQQE